VLYKDAANEAILKKGRELVAEMHEAGIRAHLDDRPYNPGWKYNHWELRGVPLRIEIGPKDLENQQLVFVRRDREKHKETVKLANYVARVGALLEEIQKELFTNAQKQRDSRVSQVRTWTEFMGALDKGNLALAPWCDETECEEDTKLKSAGKEVVHLSEEEVKKQAEEKKAEAREKKKEQIKGYIKKYQEELARMEALEGEKEHHGHEGEKESKEHKEKLKGEKEEKIKGETEEKEDKYKEKEKDATGFGLKAAAKTLCKPFEHPELSADAVCFSCGKKAKAWTLWGRSY